MCGIAGIVAFDNDFMQLKYIYDITTAQRHRGPDDEGFVFFDSTDSYAGFYGGDDTPESVFASAHNYTPTEKYTGQPPPTAFFAMGHRRLSILDLSPAGHQPMCTPDQRFWIVYNGEIYNYLELREELLDSGYFFRSQSDTEVLLNAYAAWGELALNRFIGMFAFALYDSKTNRLFLARDFFGIKPLYYASWQNGFAFASEIKALLCIPQVHRSINPQRVYEYLRFGVTDTGGDTFFENVNQLPAAHYLIVNIRSPETVSPVRYWDIDRTEKADLSFEEAANVTREIFLENIKLHLRSDVPVGAALSGGIDSSSIVMGVRQVLEPGVDLNTFSFIAEDPAVNEKKWAELVAETSDAQMHTVQILPDELASDLDRLLYIQDEPFGSTSIYAQYRIMRLSNEKGIKVMLDGQGADEMLAGYPPYYSARLASLVLHFQWIKTYQFIRHVIKTPNFGLTKLLWHAGNYMFPAAFRTYLRNKKSGNINSNCLHEFWFNDHDINRYDKNTRSGRDILREELYRSLTQLWLTSLLRYEDRNSMAFSIESRVPFLTPKLVNFISSLPEEYIIDFSGTNKSVFRQAMRGTVPDAILDRKEKIGFATPENRWLLNMRNWVESVFNSDAARLVPFLNISSINKTWKKILNKGEKFDFTIWRWINFIRWSDHYDVTYP
jgi:asparagine synthase (glutamine-hydrolysing)